MNHLQQIVCPIR